MPLSPQTVHVRLREASRRVRWSRCARYAISGTAVSLFFLVVFLLCDAQFHFGAIGRWTGFVSTISALLAGIAMALRATRPRISEASIARRIEASCAGSDNVLISAVQFDRELSAESPLRSALFNEMRDPFSQVNWSAVLDLKLLKKLAMAFGAVALALVGWGLLKPMYFANSAARIFLPASNIAPLTRTQFAEIKPGDAQIVHGKNVAISARLSGEIPRAVWFYFRESGGSWQRALMDREVGAPVFSFQSKELRQSLEYCLEAGDARSEIHRLNVRPKTASRVRSAVIEPPAYTHLGNTEVKDFAALQNVVPGSRIALTLDFNNPVPELHASEENGQAFTAEKLGDARWRLIATVTSNQTLKLDYHDVDDVADRESLQIIVKPDEPPKIAIAEPAEGKEIIASRDRSVRIVFSATDNFGLASLALYRSSNEAQDAELIQDWKGAADRKSLSAQAVVPLANFAQEDRVTFCLIAKDANNVTGPGVTISRPIVVTLRSVEQVKQQAEEASARLRQSLEELIKLQKVNLDATRAASAATSVETLAGLLNRQAAIGEIGKKLAVAAETLSPEVRSELRGLSEKEMPAAVLALRTASGAPGAPRAKPLAAATELESVILARLQGTPAAAASDALKGQMQDLISGVEDLLRRQRELFRATNNNAGKQAAKPLSEQQDALAEDSQRVRKALQSSAQNAALGDQDFRARLAKAQAMFGELRVYEEMLAAAEKLQSGKFPDAGAVEKQIVANLAKIAELLNQWQLANAAREAEELKKEAQKIADKLGKLAAIQGEVVEKSKEEARKNEARPEDVATSKEIKDTKDLMEEVIEQMLTDAHIFPDLKPSNELRSELTQIYEDVIQSDKQEVADGKLKPEEIAVQKEDGLLQAIEQAQKIAEDMEMWLPNKNETQKWELENFDKTEMPEIPNLPLPDAFEDIVGKLLDEQQALADQVQDAASNQAMAQNAANGWEIRDGPMPGFGAQGKSGNERPNKNEQTGRSSGGREGMSDGEMVGDTASNLEGSKPDVRRTNDPMQQGQVRDNGGIGQTRATGGGKAGGFSDRNGMDGNAPLRPSNAPRMAAPDALAVQQALLAEKTSKTYAQASMLYLRANGMPDVARLMEESQVALKEGRVQDFKSLHQKIAGRLNNVKNSVADNNVVVLPTDNAARTADKQLLGGDEGQAPAQYKDAVADYYRSLVEEK